MDYLDRLKTIVGDHEEVHVEFGYRFYTREFLAGANHLQLVGLILARPINGTPAINGAYMEPHYLAVISEDPKPKQYAYEEPLDFSNAPHAPDLARMFDSGTDLDYIRKIKDKTIRSLIDYVGQESKRWTP